MKKIIIIFIQFVLLSSCKAKHKTTRVHTNTRKVEDRVNRKPQTTNPKPQITNHRPQATNHKPQTTSIKTVYNSQLIDDLYANQPNLNQSKIAYIKKYNKLAINEMQAYKIPASITLAQGLLESRYGLSELTQKSKNHFGIKCHKWTGKYVYHDDDAKNECFRKYDYDASSYRDHSLFLVGSKRYAKLFTYASDDYKSWAKGLQKAGYATDSRYPKKLILLIEEYKLYTFDKLVLGENYKPKVRKKPIQRKYHIVEVGETLYSISGDYYVSVNEIKRLNKLKSNNISVGQKLVLVGKKEIKSIKTKQHKVQKGDTLYTLSKKYNLTVEKIKTLNNLVTNDLSIGQLLFMD